MNLSDILFICYLLFIIPLIVFCIYKTNKPKPNQYYIKEYAYIENSNNAVIKSRKVFVICKRLNIFETRYLCYWQQSGTYIVHWDPSIGFNVFSGGTKYIESREEAEKVLDAVRTGNYTIYNNEKSKLEK